MSWISINDDLPPCGVPVLVCTADVPAMINSDRYKSRIYLMERFMRPRSTKCYYWNMPEKGKQISDVWVSHWMPLPKLPSA